MSHIETLPIQVTGKDGNAYFLRIKARVSGKKWCIRYIRKVQKSDKNIAGWKYRTEIQAWNMDLERCAKRAHQALLLHGYTDFVFHK